MGWLGTVVLAALLGWWAAGQASTPPTIASPAAAPVTVTATEGTVVEVLPLGVSASWPMTITFVSGRDGTLTSLGTAAADPVEAGDTVATIDLEPVVVAEGEVPAFRALGPGARGADVRQLRDLLAAEGFLQDAAGQEFDEETEAAVRQWQEQLGVDATGVVEPGVLLFVPDLPRPLVPAGEVQIGSRVAPGQPLLAAPQAQPRLSLGVGVDRAADLMPGIQVRVDVDGDQRRFLIERLETDPETQQTTAILAGESGGPVCSRDCADLVQAGGERVLPAEVVLVPPTRGTVVPAAAVTTGADGVPAIRRADGEPVEVEVLASAQGRSVVRGIEPGQVVQLQREQAADAGG